MDKLAAKLGHRPKSQEVDENDVESIVVEVTLDLAKHPPPQLAPAPEGLTPQQVKTTFPTVSRYFLHSYPTLAVTCL